MEDNLDYLSTFHDSNDTGRVMLVYDGVMTKELIAAFINRLKIDIERTHVSKQEKKRFFAIVVECIQNLSKHGNVSEQNNTKFLILVEKEVDQLKISTGNTVDKDKQHEIAERIDLVNSKNQEELQELYRHGIVNNVLTDKGEASLGLIDIARKSDDKIKYQFQEIDAQKSFFLFQTQILTNKD
ncbi:SiaB family protein kinase [Crocinitomix algicola]|uniref:SiaB family protein kinase n=1 Tax=Crocinitomix algicola TaxID=1740263 RepID=UPI001112CC41|nr:SiaB family protein kinase [Crocinitomix algicola]